MLKHLAIFKLTLFLFYNYVNLLRDDPYKLIFVLHIDEVFHWVEPLNDSTISQFNPQIFD